MGDGAKTGNPFLDAWLAAMTPLAPPERVADATPPAGIPLGGFERWAQAASRLAGPWNELAQRSLGTLTAMGSLAKAGDPLGDALEQSFSVVGETGPASAQVPVALAEAATVTSRLFAAREAYRAYMTATWQRACEAIVREAMRLTAEGAPPATPAQWLTLSNSIADRTFVETFNSEAYLEVQGRLSSALADQRRSETKLVEMFAQFGHFPTRRALDEAGAEINDLRRRVRRLERALRANGKAEHEEREDADVR